MDIIIAIGIFNSLVFVFLLIAKANKALTDKILTYWMVLFALNLLSAFLTLKLDFPIKTILAVFTTALFIAHFPFLFIYTKSLTGAEFKIGWKQYINFLPVVIMLVVSIPYFRLNINQQKQMAYSTQNISWFFLVTEAIFTSTFILYISKTVLLLRKNAKIIKNAFSYEEKVNLAWIKNLIIGFVSLLLLTIVIFILSNLKVFNIVIGDEVLYVALVVIVLYVGFWGYKQGKIFYHIEPLLMETETVEPQGKINIEQPRPETTQTIELLQELLKEEKPYLNPELTIVSLAAKLDIQPYKLSRIINTHFQQNFFDFINQYRVEEFKSLAQDEHYKHFSILAIAFEAGFNSKASFNRIFKNITGETPSGFIKKQ